MGEHRIKYLPILLSILLLSTSFSTYGNAEIKLTTIYVDDDNIDGPWDGTKEHPYQFIQDGIDAANNKDTIIVETGEYNENLRITKNISLIGTTKEETIISSSKPSELLILDTVENTIIMNLTFSSDAEEMLDSIKMINCSHCTISNIKINSPSLERSAIIVNGLSNVINNICIKGRFIYSGIELYYTHYNTIENNTIDSTGAGILIFRSHNNLISSNKMTNNSNAIYIEEGNKNYITHNSINNNDRGLFSSYSTKNIITNNNFIENDEQAKFTKLLRKDFIPPNNWDNNYWDDHKGLPIKPIPGIIYIPNRHLIGFFLPWLAFDRNPSSEPFNLL